MRNLSVEEKLRKILIKLAKKDKVTYEAFVNKFKEILTCKDVNRYKNLKKPLHEFKRVHIKSSFVLTFKYIESKNKVIFYNLDHHDNIYRH